MVPLIYNYLVMTKVKKFRQLCYEERVKIEVLLQQGLSMSAIAREMNRPVCTICRELKRNGTVSYRCAKADYLAKKRHRRKPKHSVLDQEMIDFIDRCLRQYKWSPELISAKGRQLRGDFISHEWIYRWVWSMKFSQVKTHKKYRLLYKYLKHGSGRKRRGKQHGNRGNIIDRKWIEERPGIVNRRCRQGDLEADVVLGKDRQPGLVVAIDRKTRKMWIRKIETKAADYVMRKLKAICVSIGSVKTITLDNDPSFAHHYELHSLGIKTFFTHPFSSQEKGSVENRIGVLRRFYPKKTDFRTISEQEIRETEKLLNQRPMRMFKYRSPNEIHIS
jgi:IS30 family transposase